VKVEILYVAECPSHPEAVKLVKDILAAQGVKAEIREILVRDEQTAGKLKFLGSPTIRINGHDVVADQRKSDSFALRCRLYPGSKQVGVPSEELIRRAVVKAREHNV
jgi:hypothetical protein